MLQVQCSPLQTLLATSVGRMNGVAAETRPKKACDADLHSQDKEYRYCKPELAQIILALQFLQAT